MGNSHIRKGYTDTIRLNPQGSYKITTIDAPFRVSDVNKGFYVSTINSDHKCFSLCCGFSYDSTFQDSNIKSFLNSTKYVLVPFTSEDALSFENGDTFIVYF